MKLTLKRAYEKPSPEDGKRILVDRLWPRGLSKDGAKIDLWLKEIAPSTELRKWFDHDQAKWPEFVSKYQQELSENSAVQALLAELKQGKITLVYAAKDEDHNNAVVLRNFMSQKFKN